MAFRKELLKILHGAEVTDADLETFVNEIIAPNQDKLPVLHRFSPADYALIEKEDSSQTETDGGTK